MHVLVYGPASQRRRNGVVQGLPVDIGTGREEQGPDASQYEGSSHGIVVVASPKSVERV